MAAPLPLLLEKKLLAAKFSNGNINGQNVNEMLLKREFTAASRGCLRLLGAASIVVPPKMTGHL